MSRGLQSGCDAPTPGAMRTRKSSTASPTPAGESRPRWQSPAQATPVSGPERSSPAGVMGSQEESVVRETQGGLGCLQGDASSGWATGIDSTTACSRDSMIDHARSAPGPGGSPRARQRQLAREGTSRAARWRRLGPDGVGVRFFDGEGKNTAVGGGFSGSRGDGGR